MVEFKGGYNDVKNLPAHQLPEYCFIGRSNVRKSSLLNYLSHSTTIAKISKKPGKTQAINLFHNSEGYYFVDLPGYGYAITSKKQRVNWKKMIDNYLLNRQNLVLCFVLIDSRIPFQNIDREFIDWCGENNIPIALVMTKKDDVKKLEFEQNMNSIFSKLKQNWEPLPEIFYVSSIKKTGGEEILEYIMSINDTLNEAK